MRHFSYVNWLGVRSKSTVRTLHPQQAPAAANANKKPSLSRKWPVRGKRRQMNSFVIKGYKTSFFLMIDMAKKTKLWGIFAWAFQGGIWGWAKHFKKEIVLGPHIFFKDTKLKPCSFRFIFFRYYWLNVNWMSDYIIDSEHLLTALVIILTNNNMLMHNSLTKTSLYHEGERSSVSMWLTYSI